MSVSSPILCSNKYKIAPHTRQELLNLHCTPVGKSSDQLFLYKFPVWKYKNTTTIEGSLLIDTLGKVHDFKVYDTSTHDFYRIFYHFDERYAFGSRFITGLENAIKFTFHRLGVEDDI